jgi:hypothetical protein
MIGRESRYANCGTDVYETADGTRVLYLRRRFLPAGEDVPSSRDFETIDRSMRLDTVAALTIGDAQQFWRVCDANDALNPFDLLAENEGRLRVPTGQTIR